MSAQIKIKLQRSRILCLLSHWKWIRGIIFKLSTFGIMYSLLLLIIQNTILISEISLIAGEKCYVGNTSGNKNNKWSYTLTPRDPCACTSLIFTGKNNEEIILTKDVDKIRKYLGVVTCSGGCAYVCRITFLN